MLAWIGKLLAGKFVQDEIAKLKAEISSAAQAVANAKVLKDQLYVYADGILAEGQSVSKERLDSWWVQKRAELKTWAGK